MRESVTVLIALVAALVLGVAIAAAGSATLLHDTSLIAPIGTAWINAIRMTVIPLVVSLLVTGVASATDMKAIGRIGIRTAAAFGLLLTGTALVIVPLAPMVFRALARTITVRPPLPAGAAEAAGQLGGQPTQSFGSWLVSLIPANPVAAAANGAMVPLIIFTVLFALALTRLPATTRERIVAPFAALRDAMLVLVRWVIALAPIGVFALVLPLAAQGGAALAGAVGFYVVAYSAGCILITLLLYPTVALATRVGLRRFAAAALPPQLIAFSTSSSIAVLPALIESAEQQLGLDDRVSGFVLPVAVSTFKIAGPIAWPIGSLFVAWFYGIPLHTQALLLLTIGSIFLGFVAPGIPRGAFLMLAPLFMAVGLPVEGLGILIAVDAIPDLFATVVNTTGNLTAALLVARADVGVRESTLAGAPAPSFGGATGC